jgi:gliding motility-associated-like protein
VAFRNRSTGVANSFEWDFGDGSPVSNLPEPTHTYDQPGIYIATLTVRSLAGCGYPLASRPIRVGPSGLEYDFTSEPPYPARFILPDATARFEPDVPEAVSWQWDFGDQQFSNEPAPAHTWRAPGTYTVVLTATDVYGCTHRIAHGPYVVQPPVLDIPNVFTPLTADGVNDTWKPLYNGSDAYRLVIFDRWGNRLFATTDPTEAWNGRSPDGNTLPTGVYFYVIEVGSRRYDGHFTLMD